MALTSYPSKEHAQPLHAYFNAMASGCKLATVTLTTGSSLTPASTEWATDGTLLALNSVVNAGSARAGGRARAKGDASRMRATTIVRTVTALASSSTRGVAHSAGSAVRLEFPHVAARRWTRGASSLSVCRSSARRSVLTETLLAAGCRRRAAFCSSSHCYVGR